MSSDPSSLTAAYFHLCCIVGGAVTLTATLILWTALKLSRKMERK